MMMTRKPVILWLVVVGVIFAVFIVLTAPKPDPPPNGHQFNAILASAELSHLSPSIEYSVHFYVTNLNASDGSPHCHVSIAKVGATTVPVGYIYSGKSIESSAVIRASTGTVEHAVPPASVKINCV